MSESPRDRWMSIGMSVLLHGTIIGLLAYGWWRYEHRPINATPSIEATVVNAHALEGKGVVPKPVAKPKPKPKPVPKPPPQPVHTPQGPPAPTPQEQVLRQQAAQAEAARIAAAKAEQARLHRLRLEAKAKAEARAKARAEARRKREQARRRAEQRKLAAERAAKARAQRIAQLRQALQEDAQNNAKMRSAVAGWASEVKQRVEAAWIKPASARSNLSCTVRVQLVPGGAVSHVSLGSCNGDEAVRESIQAAVYRASPLPPPPDPQLYHEPLNFIFAPNSH